MSKIYSVFLLFFLLYSAFSEIKATENTPFPPYSKVGGEDTINQDEVVNSDFVYNIKQKTGEITLDGAVNEPAWKSAQKADDFFMVLPYDTGRSRAESEIMMTYDEEYLYVAAVFYDSLPGDRIVESLSRDFNFGSNDNFLLFLDTYQNQTTGYSFGVNAAGAKWDGTMSDGHAVNLVWDCKWEAETRNYDNRWVTEMRIPFKSISYKNGAKQWNVQFSRLDLKLNEKSAWAPVPRQFPTASLAYAGVLQWDSPPPESNLQFSLIPYAFGSASRDFEADEDINYKKKLGMDAKVGLGSSFNLDLTYNPDFSQAEVDQQVTNLDRFELFYPEKRQFFLDNSDLFANYGSRRIRPFFSRRIGLDAPVLGGARLSGNMGSDWRVGIMDMQTEKTSALPASNFFVASVQRKVFSRSNIGALFVNKELTSDYSSSESNGYNRVAGLEYNLASKNNYWNGEFFGLRSFTQGVSSDDQFSQGMNLEYSRQQFSFEVDQSYVGREFVAETGYVPRNDFFRITPEASYRFYPDIKNLEYHGIEVEAGNFYCPEDFKLTDRDVSFDYFFQFRDRSRLDIEGQYTHVLLRDKFDPTNKDVDYLPSGNSYNWKKANVRYESDNRKLFQYDIEAGYGGFYNGERGYVKGELSYRYQPYGSISMAFSYNDLKLPEPWGRTDFWLIGPKIDITFTDEIFFTTYVQYNEQLDNLNVNSRFQWRYSQVSDLYLVYTDNYFPESMDSKNRSLVLKISYWFN